MILIQDDICDSVFTPFDLIYIRHAGQYYGYFTRVQGNAEIVGPRRAKNDAFCDYCYIYACKYIGINSLSYDSVRTRLDYQSSIYTIKNDQLYAVQDA